MGLFEQLEQNKADKQSDWEEQQRITKLPKALDDDEVSFLNEEQEKKSIKRRKLRENDEEALKKFAEARSKFFQRPTAPSRTVKMSFVHAPRSASARPLPGVEKQEGTGVVFRKRRRGTHGRCNEEGSNIPAKVYSEPSGLSTLLAAYESSSSDDEDDS